MTARTVCVYDPAMCCPTGACGPDPDPELVRMAMDLQWLETERGVIVERHNLGSEPGAFAADPVVLGQLNERGVESLPLVIIGQQILSSGTYPSRDELLEALGIDDDA